MTVDTEGITDYGTGEKKGFESDYIDTYVEHNKQQSQDFYILNQEIWKFLIERFGGQPILRRYARSTNFGSFMQVDAKLF